MPLEIFSGESLKQLTSSNQIQFKSPKSNIQYEATRLPDYNKVGNIIAVTVAWRGGTYMVKMFFPTVKKPSRKEVQDQVRKVYPGSKLVTYQVSEYDSGEPIIQTR